jgi:hypothetical protein
MAQCDRRNLKIRLLQRAAHRVDAHLIQETGKRFSRMLLELARKGRPAHPGHFQEIFKAHRLRVMGQDVTDRAPNGLLLLSGRGERECLARKEAAIPRRRLRQARSKAPETIPAGAIPRSPRFVSSNARRSPPSVPKVRSLCAPLRGAAPALPGFSQAPDSVIQRKVPLQRHAGRFSSGMPVVRNIRPDQHQIPGFEKSDMIPHEARAGASRNRRQLDRPMVVPVVSMTRGRRRVEGIQHHLHGFHAAIPSQHAKRLPLRKMDIFTKRGHRWHH